MKVDDHPEQMIVRQELLRASLEGLMDWIVSFAHPLVTQQMLRQLGASLAQRSHARIQLTQGRTKIQLRKKSSGLLFQNLMQECGWETRLIQESKHHMDLALPICPFGSQAAGSQNFCVLHLAVSGEAAVYQFGYAKISLQRGPGTPPRDCSMRVYTVRSEESLAADGVEYTSDPDQNSVPTVMMHDGSVARLSPRECDVLRLVGDGLTDKEIASTLSLSVRTAENHVARIRDKLDIRGRAGLIRFAFQHHLNSV